LRRFCQHILPQVFCKVRHYGFTANAGKAKSLGFERKIIYVTQKELLDKRVLAKQKVFKKEADHYPCCKTKKMDTIEVFSVARAPLSVINSQAYLTSLV